MIAFGWDSLIVRSLQIDLTQSALGDDARYAAAVFFLIVAGVMLMVVPTRAISAHRV